MGDLGNKKIFAENLNYYMTLNKKDRNDVARDLELPYTTVTSWCNAEFYPRIDKIQLLANYFGIQKSDLVEDNHKNNNYFIYVTEDDAMFPLLDIGDKALIHKQTEIDNVDIAIKGTYLIKVDNKTTIRKIVLSEDKTYYSLIAMNTYCKKLDIPVDEFNQIQILGKVVKAENESAFK